MPFRRRSNGRPRRRGRRLLVLGAIGAAIAYRKRRLDEADRAHPEIAHPE